MEKEIHFGAIIHLLGWELKESVIELDSKVSLIDLEQHALGKLYNKMCYEKGMEDGDPLNFRVGVVIKDDIGDTVGSPYTTLSRVMNVLTIAHLGSLGFVRTFFSSDNFKTASHTNELYDYSDFDDLQIFQSKIDNERIEIVKKLWSNTKLIWHWERQISRITNALIYYNYAWDVYSNEQTAINLSIVIEILFAPHSQGELTHQIAYNAACYLGKNKEDRIKIYELMKSFYGVRSKLVHGDYINAKDEKIIVNAFKFISEILQKILLHNKHIQIFNNNKLRKQFLADLIFS